MELKQADFCFRRRQAAGRLRKLLVAAEDERVVAVAGRNHKLAVASRAAGFVAGLAAVSAERAVAARALKVDHR